MLGSVLLSFILSAPPTSVSRPSAVQSLQLRVDNGQFEQAAKGAEIELGTAQTNEERCELLRLLAVSHLYLGDEAKANQALKRLAVLAPQYQLPTGSPPKLTQAWESIRKDQLRAAASLQADGAIPTKVAADEDLLLRFKKPSAPIKHSMAYIRFAGSNDWQAIALEVTDLTQALEFRLPREQYATKTAPFAVELAIECFDDKGARTAAFASRLTPHILQVLPASNHHTNPPTETKKPIWKKPVFWIATAGGLALIGGGAYLLTRPSTADVRIRLVLEE